MQPASTRGTRNDQPPPHEKERERHGRQRRRRAGAGWPAGTGGWSTLPIGVVELKVLTHATVAPLVNV